MVPAGIRGAGADAGIAAPAPARMTGRRQIVVIAWLVVNQLLGAAGFVWLWLGNCLVLGWVGRPTGPPVAATLYQVAGTICHLYVPICVLCAIVAWVWWKNIPIIALTISVIPVLLLVAAGVATQQCFDLGQFRPA